MLKLTLVTPNKKVLIGEEVEELFVPAFRGELNILPGHATLITTLTAGVMRYRLKGADLYSYSAISWGYCEAHGEEVSILAETAELPKEVDKERAANALKEAEEKLASPDVTPEDLEKFTLKKARAEARLYVVEQGPVSQQ